MGHLSHRVEFQNTTSKQVSNFSQEVREEEINHKDTRNANSMTKLKAQIQDISTKAGY